MTCSAVLAHFWGGFIEAHFHFFVMVGVIAVYEDWVPFLLAILYVAVQHGLFGMIAPGAVYNHSPAIENPWGWAIIHAVFVLGLSAAIVLHWQSIGRAREETETQLEHLRQRNQEIEDLEERRAEIEAAKTDAEEAKAEAEAATAEARARQQEVEQLNEQLLVHAADVAASMDAVADGNFTAEPPTDTDIEAIEEISDAFEQMTDELAATVLDLREFAATVESATQSVQSDAVTLERQQQRQAEDVRDFATELRDLASDLDSSTDELGDLSATIEEIAANADQVSNEAATAAAAAADGNESATAAIEAIEAIEQRIDELADLITVLDDRMDDVADSTALIEDIADQTNVLALNASIEAAHSKDGGEGFAVVADEVKALATETQDHSTAIQRTIGETVEDVERVQREMDRTKARLETGKTTVSDAGETFSTLSETVETVDTSVDEVAVATDDGARSTEAIVDAVTRVADRARAIAERSESLADRAEESTTTVAEVRSQLDDLADRTATLQRQLEAFECESDDAQSPTVDADD
ncbi:methyl-accepting chemotaxis protein [Salinadaptatus halalkaliphilus]|uniref:methyl-accepting chemotaxis protein n=1 Tax=Salinadaptatus halalkaliphilus TaxID=2419781 RepID=UPI001C2C77DA|nr:methyl-accepting chemotaxis protein [Salinadaptatus halalkaliphilus]